MAFEARIKDAEHVSELDFPRIMRCTDSGIVVLFETETEGTVIAGHPKEMAKRLDNPSSHFFVDFYGEITLKNG